MSVENVELVRRTLGALDRALEAYWRDPRPIIRAYEDGELWPEWEEWFSYVHPEIEWRTVFLGETFHGHEECVRVWHDFLRWADDYRVTLEEIEDFGGGQVFVVITIGGRSKNSDARMGTRFYSVATVRDGQVARLAEYTDREEALEAAQLQGRGDVA
jgi:ketosteroid isomerase-like protein